MAWDFWGARFWSRDFLGIIGTPRDSFGIDFCPHSIIPVSWNSEYPRSDATIIDKMGPFIRGKIRPVLHKTRLK